MLRYLVILSSSLILLASIASAQEPVVDSAPENGWYADFDKATEAAKREKKDLLVDFTGSDWCGWCIKLHKEVFVHEEFRRKASEDFIFVALDYPRSEELKAKVPNPARNAELVKKYAIRAYPTIILMSADGEAFARTGYQAGGVETYLQHLDKIATTGRKAVAGAKVISAEFAAAQDDAAKVIVVTKALDLLKGMKSDDIGFSALADVAKHGLTLDADNKQGLKGKVLGTMLKSGGATAEMNREAREFDPKNAKGLLELAVAADARQIASLEALRTAVKDIEALIGLGPIRDAEIDLELSANLAFWHHEHLKDAEKAKRYALRAKKLAGDRPEFQRLFKMILGESK